MRGDFVQQAPRKRRGGDAPARSQRLGPALLPESPDLGRGNRAKPADPRGRPHRTQHLAFRKKTVFDHDGVDDGGTLGNIRGRFVVGKSPTSSPEGCILKAGLSAQKITADAGLMQRRFPGAAVEETTAKLSGAGMRGKGPAYGGNGKRT